MFDGHREAAVPRRRRIVRMTFEPRRHRNQLFVRERRVGHPVARGQRPHDGRRAGPETHTDRNLVLYLQVKTSRLAPAFESTPDRAGDQIGVVGRDPLGRYARVTCVHRAVRARPDVEVQVEAERQRRAVKGAAQVRASCRYTDGDLLGHRAPRSELYALRFDFLLHCFLSKSKARKGRSELIESEIRN